MPKFEYHMIIYYYYYYYYICIFYNIYIFIYEFWVKEVEIDFLSKEVSNRK